MENELRIYIVTPSDECLSYCPHREGMLGSTACMEDCNAHTPIKTDLAYRFRCELSKIRYRKVVVKIVENN